MLSMLFFKIFLRMSMLRHLLRMNVECPNIIPNYHAELLNG